MPTRFSEAEDEELARFAKPMVQPRREHPDPLGLRERTADIESRMSRPLRDLADNRIRMGELAALDRYGVVGRPSPPDPRIARALELSGPGYAEDRAYGWRPLSDAISGQLKPPLPPTLQEQPAWTREPVNPDDVRDFVRPYVPDEDWA